MSAAAPEGPPEDPSGTRPFTLGFTEGRAWAWHARRTAPTLRRLPLARFVAADFPAAARARAQRTWTQLSFTEVRAASTLAQLTQRLLAADVPLDLASLASTLPQQELLHAEICARVAVALGGTAHLRPAATAWAGCGAPPAGLTPRQQAAGLVVGHCCVAETLSFRLLLHGMGATEVPLVHDALRLLARDEALHSELGWLFLDWYAPQADAAERRRLGAIAAATMARCRTPPAALDAAAEAAAASPLDWIQPAAARAVEAEVWQTCVRAPLADYGIEVPHGAG